MRLILCPIIKSNLISCLSLITCDWKIHRHHFNRGYYLQQVTLHPKCGRFIGFESDDYHGVLPTTSGRRCMLAALYTFNPATQELARAETQTALRSSSTVRTG